MLQRTQWNKYRTLISFVYMVFAIHRKSNNNYSPCWHCSFVTSNLVCFDSLSSLLKWIYDLHWAFASQTFKKPMCHDMFCPYHGILYYYMGTIWHNQIWLSIVITLVYTFLIHGSFVLLTNINDIYNRKENYNLT